jgi:hypothetical protein
MPFRRLRRCLALPHAIAPDAAMPTPSDAPFSCRDADIASHAAPCASAASYAAIFIFATPIRRFDAIRSCFDTTPLLRVIAAAAAGFILPLAAFRHLIFFADAARLRAAARPPFRFHFSITFTPQMPPMVTPPPPLSPMPRFQHCAIIAAAIISPLIAFITPMMPRLIY